MKSKLKIMFYLKKNQTKKEGLSSVMGRIQNGCKLNYPTSIPITLDELAEKL